MAQALPEWTDYHRRRWMRSNAHLHLRPDAQRWLRPDHKRFLLPGTDLRRLLPVFEGKANFNPNQPRVPAGHSEGGQWTGLGGTNWTSRQSTDEASFEYEEPVRLAQLEGILDDAGRRYYNPGGHHELSKGVYGKWNLSDEVRRIFDKATTGTVPRGTIRFSPDGEPQDTFGRAEEVRMVSTMRRWRSLARNSSREMEYALTDQI